MSLLSQVQDNLAAMENESGLQEIMDDAISGTLSDPDVDIGDVYGRPKGEVLPIDESLDEDGDLDDIDLDPDLGEDTDEDIDDILAEDEEEDGSVTVASSNGFGRTTSPGFPQSTTKPYEESEDNEPYFQNEKTAGLLLDDDDDGIDDDDDLD